MLSEILLRLLAVMTVDDVRECKRLGLEAEVRDLLAIWDRMTIEWRQIEYGHIDSRVWSDVQIKLNELRAALRG